MQFEMQNLGRVSRKGDVQVSHGSAEASGQVEDGDAIALARSGKKQVLTVS